MSQIPAGEERKVKFLGGAAIDGAPIAYIVILAAVVTVLSFIPFSVVLSSGGTFPMSQGVYPLMGWILGPIAGALANGIGALIGLFVAPHTAGVPAATMCWAILGGLLAGMMVIGEERKSWWIVGALLGILALVLYLGRAILNGIPLGVVILGTIIDWSGVLLFVLPSRTLFARWINSEKLGLVAAGLFLGSWMISGIAHAGNCVITYWMFNWPEEVWRVLIPIIPVENLFRCLVGTVIGTGVIAGLRSIGIVKPKYAIF